MNDLASRHQHNSEPMEEHLNLEKLNFAVKSNIVRNSLQNSEASQSRSVQLMERTPVKGFSSCKTLCFI